MPDVQSPITPGAALSPTSGDNDQATHDGTDALAHLARMSGTGSAFGQADYVVLNPLAIASLILGFASALALVVSLFLFIPVAGIICGLISLRQIRKSSGTQSGLGFALGGMALSLGLGGYVLSQWWASRAQLQVETQQCAAVISQFGDDLKAATGLSDDAKNQRYDSMYDNLMSAAFRTRVKRADFRTALAPFQGNAVVGPLESIKWNGEQMEFDPLPDGNARMAFSMALLHFHNVPDPGAKSCG